MNDSPAVILYDVTGIEVGTSGNPLRIDPTGTTTQPISAASLPLPTGAATEATLATRASEATLATRASEATLAAINGKTPALGQAAMAASTPVVIASNQSAVPISAASLPLPTGAATETTLAAINTKTPALGQAAMAASTPVVIASNQSAVPTTPPKAATPATTNVARSAVSTTLLAANANRLGAMLYNDAAAVCYVKFGGAASTTSFTVRMAAQSYFEVPFNYTGIIEGIWASAGAGAMRVTELTA